MKKLAILLVIIIISLNGCKPKEPDIVVGAKDFTEQYILGYILTLLIEANTNLTVDYKSDLASSLIFASLRTGVVDLYVDYTGTVYGNYLKMSESKSAEEIHEISVRELNERYDIRMLEPLGFNNTFSLAVSAGIAAEYNLTTISDLARVSSNFALGGSTESLSRYDSIPNMKKMYNMSFREEIPLDDNDRYTAIAEDIIQVAVVFATDGMLLEYDLTILQDDLGFFHPYHGAIVIRGEIAEKYPELITVLNKLNGTITDDIMRNLDYMVDVSGETPRAAAEYFLKTEGFID